MRGCFAELVGNKGVCECLSKRISDAAVLGTSSYCVFLTTRWLVAKCLQSPERINCVLI